MSDDATLPDDRTSWPAESIVSSSESPPLKTISFPPELTTNISAVPSDRMLAVSPALSVNPLLVTPEETVMVIGRSFAGLASAP